jgi:hypothetical protein
MFETKPELAINLALNGILQGNFNPCINTRKYN